MGPLFGLMAGICFIAEMAGYDEIASKAFAILTFLYIVTKLAGMADIVDEIAADNNGAPQPN